MGRKVPPDPHIRKNWTSTSVNVPRETYSTIVKEMEEWCETSIPGRWAYEYNYQRPFPYTGYSLNFYFKDATDCTHFKLSW